MTAYDIIMKKRRGSELFQEEIEWITSGFVSGDIPDYQMSALLMAICFNGMTSEETSALTTAMINSGDTYSPSKELGRICIDKHSTGGIGDKTTLIAVPICAACGIYVPKMSGRGLGHTGGTIDKLEAIPGLRTSLTHNEFISVTREAGFAISGQTGSLVPADKKIYALRNATATVDSIPLICSSIMSKKLATGADGIVLDVKVGDGAFMKNYADAEKLAEAMIRVAGLSGKKCTAVLTNMEKPLGMAVGNAVEVVEAIEALKGNCPDDLYDISVTLASEMLFLAGLGSPERCRELATDALSSGRALKAFEKMSELQGGNSKAFYDYSLLGVPTHTREVVSDIDGYISGISCEKTGLVSLALGAGRKTKDGNIDPTAGIIFNKTVGDFVKKGETLGRLVTSSDCDIDAAEKDFIGLFRFSETAPEKIPAVIKIIRS
ncbi:MAG: thymidine phosphorylase [Oscillospiraceae bacterium]|nr:thymidine phosphorylase [Oscillospiraceae bacterium]